MRCTPAVSEVNDLLSCVCQRCHAIDYADHNGVVGNKLKGRAELSVCMLFGAEPISVIRVLMLAVRGNQ